MVGGHEANGIGLKDGRRFGVENELEELSVVGSGGVEATAAGEDLRGGNGAAGVWTEEAAGLAALVGNEARELSAGENKACVLHVEGRENVALEVLFEV